ncbi:MAG: PAS domain-containing protein [Gemmataceae bacterium]
MVIGVGWILPSDTLLLRLDPEGHYPFLASAKGIVYVAVTAALFFVVARRRAGMVQDTMARLLTALTTQQETADQLRATLAQRDRVQKDLLAVSEHVDVAVNAAGLGLWSWEAATGEVYLSPSWKAQLGYAADELPSRLAEWEERLHPEDAADARRSLHAFLADPGPVFEAEYRLRHRDGRYRWMLTQARPWRVADRPAVYVAGAQLDITERRQREETLRLLQAAVECVQEGIVVIAAPIDPAQLGVVYVNPAFTRLSGYTAADAGGHAADLLAGRAAPAALRAAVDRGEAFNGELSYPRKDGCEILVEVQIIPLRDGAGAVGHYVCVQRDVTVRRRMETQLLQSRKMEAIGQLAGGVAHDFNNLLTIINGYADLLLFQLPPGDPSREVLEEIRRAGERSAVLTRRLLAFGRRQVVAPQVLGLNAVLLGAETVLRRLLGTDVQLVVDPADDLPPIFVDPADIEQVLVNLVVNARDATPPGGQVTMRTRQVATTAADGPGDAVLLEIADTGSGMTDEVKARIFEPFFTTKGARGTGLGLPTVYAVVEQAGGRIEVDSQPGAGTTFRLCFPTTRRPIPHPPPSPADPPAGTEAVLLVEDEPGCGCWRRATLAAAGYRVIEANDVATAIDRCRAPPGADRSAADRRGAARRRRAGGGGRCAASCGRTSASCSCPAHRRRHAALTASARRKPTSCPSRSPPATWPPASAGCWTPAAAERPSCARTPTGRPVFGPLRGAMPTFREHAAIHRLTLSEKGNSHPMATKRGHGTQKGTGSGLLGAMPTLAWACGVTLPGPVWRRCYLHPMATKRDHGTRRRPGRRPVGTAAALTSRFGLVDPGRRCLQSIGMKLLVLVVRGLQAAAGGPFGNRWIETFTLDALAAQGVVFHTHLARIPSRTAPAASGGPAATTSPPPTFHPSPGPTCSPCSVTATSPPG